MVTTRRAKGGSKGKNNPRLGVGTGAASQKRQTKLSFEIVVPLIVHSKTQPTSTTSLAAGASSTSWPVLSSSVKSVGVTTRRAARKPEVIVINDSDDEETDADTDVVLVEPGNQHSTARSTRAAARAATAERTAPAKYPNASVSRHNGIQMSSSESSADSEQDTPPAAARRHLVNRSNSLGLHPAIAEKTLRSQTGVLPPVSSSSSSSSSESDSDDDVMVARPSRPAPLASVTDDEEGQSRSGTAANGDDDSDEDEGAAALHMSRQTRHFLKGKYPASTAPRMSSAEPPAQVSSSSSSSDSEDFDVEKENIIGDRDGGRTRRKQHTTYKDNLQKLKQAKTGQGPMPKVRVDNDDSSSDSEDDTDAFGGTANGKVGSSKYLDSTLTDFVVEGGDEDEEDGHALIPEEFRLSHFGDYMAKLIDYFAQLALDPTFARDLKKPKNSQYRWALDRLHSELNQRLKNMESSVWLPRFKRYLEAYPIYIAHRLPLTLDFCEVCWRTDRYSTFNIIFKGVPYDSDTFEPRPNKATEGDSDSNSSGDENDDRGNGRGGRHHHHHHNHQGSHTHEYDVDDGDDNNDEDDEFTLLTKDLLPQHADKAVDKPRAYYAGRLCKLRTQQYHRVYHYPYRLFLRVVDELARRGMDPSLLSWVGLKSVQGNGKDDDMDLDIDTEAADRAVELVRADVRFANEQRQHLKALLEHTDQVLLKGVRAVTLD